MFQYSLAFILALVKCLHSIVLKRMPDASFEAVLFVPRTLYSYLTNNYLLFVLTEKIDILTETEQNVIKNSIHCYG